MLRSLIRSALAFVPALAAVSADEIPNPSPPVVAASPGPAQAPLPPLTLEQCVAEALAKNFTVSLQSYVVVSSKEAVIVAKSTYDPVLGVSWQKSFQQQPQISPNINAYTNSTNQSTAVSVTQAVETGATITANYQLSRSGSNQPPESFDPQAPPSFNPEYDGQTSINLSQPLLAGFGLDYNRATIQIARMTETIAHLDFKTTMLTAILSVETAYFNLIYTRQEYDVGLDSLKLAQALLRENQVKYQTGVLTNLDVITAEAGVATAQSQLIGFQQAKENAEDILYQTMGERKFKSPIGKVDFPLLTGTDVSFDLSYKLARDNTPELLAQQLDIDRLKLTALRAKRDALPQLSAVGGAGYTSANSSYSLANSTLWAGPGYNWNAGLTLTMPLGMRGNRALYREAMENAEKQQVTSDQYDQNLLVQVRAAVRAVQSNVESVAASKEAALLSQKQYDLQKARFDAGLSTSLDVLTSQNLLEAARSAELQSEVTLRVALATLHYYEGTSLAEFRINVD